MTKETYGKNMMLFTSFWSNKPTFKMMPISQEAPYAEVIYDPATTLLVVISKIQKENFQYLPRLDDSGQPTPVKSPKPGQKPYKEQRVLMPTLQEYYITEVEEQKAFIENFAVNSKSFDFEKYIRNVDEEPTIHKAESVPLVDTQGKIIPMKAKKKNSKK